MTLDKTKVKTEVEKNLKGAQNLPPAPEPVNPAVAKANKIEFGSWDKTQKKLNKTLQDGLKNYQKATKE